MVNKSKAKTPQNPASPRAPASPRVWGYVRVSKNDQTYEQQTERLVSEGCPQENIVEEKISGRAAHRPRLNALLAQLTKGDTLLVWQFDRLGRVSLDLIGIIADLTDRGITVRALASGASNQTGGGRLLLEIQSLFAAQEAQLCRERTRLALARMKQEGVRLGAPLKVSNQDAEYAARRIASGSISINKMAQRLKVTRNTLKRAMRRAGVSWECPNEVITADFGHPS